MAHLKKGCLQIYCGDGKGKTTASVGLAVRAAGTGMKVYFCQVMKDGRSGEVEMLKKLGYTVTDRTIGSVWETKNRFSFACHLPKEEMRIVYFKAERDAGTEHSS